MTKINTSVVCSGRLQLWLNKVHMTWICMCGNPSAWVGFVCWGQSPLLSDAQPGIRAANRQDLDIVLPWSAGWRGFTPSLWAQLQSVGSSPPPAASCWRGRISRAFYSFRLQEEPSSPAPKLLFLLSAWSHCAEYLGFYKHPARHQSNLFTWLLC